MTAPPSTGLWRRRPALRSETLALLASLYFTLASNGAFWTAILGNRDALAGSTWLLALGTGLFVTAGQAFLLLLVVNRWTARPLLAVLLLLTAAATYFMTFYGVYLDPAMMRNLVETDTREAAELLSWKMLPWMLLFAALPGWLLWRVQLIGDPWPRALLRRAGVLLLALLLAAGGLWSAMHDLVPVLREQREMRYLLTPSNFVYSLPRVLLRETKEARKPRTPVGTDARADHPPLARRPRAFVVVVGETVRAANWGLDGYARQTTPELARRDVVNFSDVTACGTNTEVSVPCMFSPYGRRHYDEDRIRTSESLLHVLDHAGIAVLWRDNQSGCKGVCAGLPVENFFDAHIHGLCEGDRCLDEALLEQLRERIDQAPGDVFIVLHMLGNHGPAYFERYPRAFRRWTPTCDTTDLGSCPVQEVINSYDNAILYTDHVLGNAIDLLAGIRSHDTALLYLSDHGESLGENNLYLHSLPWHIAPDTQRKVPLVLWLSPGYRETAAVDSACLVARARQPAAHDNLFHTVLGLFGVQTQVYDPALDLLAACRPAPPAT